MTKSHALRGSGTYTGCMFIKHRAGWIASNTIIKTQAFWNLYLKFAYDFRIYNSFDLQSNCDARNILNSFQKGFDYGADRDSGYMYEPTLQRTFFFGVKLNYYTIVSLQNTRILRYFEHKVFTNTRLHHFKCTVCS